MEVNPSDGAVRLTLHLSYLRSLSVVGAALAKNFPTSDSWEQIRNSDEFIADLNHFDLVITDIRNDMLKAQDDDEVDNATLRLYDVAVDSVQVFAEKYNIPVEDLVYVLVHAE